MMIMLITLSILYKELLESNLVHDIIKEKTQKHYIIFKSNIFMFYSRFVFISLQVFADLLQHLRIESGECNH